jgi:hypothetical protein
MPSPTRSQFATAEAFNTAFNEWHTAAHALADRVEARVEEQYGLQDGGDLCYNLLDNGTIPESASVDEAARIVAMHLQQA